MFQPWMPFKKWKYSRVRSVDRKFDKNLCISSTKKEKSFNLFSVLCLVVFITVLAGGFGFLAGRHLPPLIPQDFLMGFNSLFQLSCQNLFNT